MNRQIVSWTLTTLLAVIVVGCGSSKRMTVEGYSDDMLMRKRVFVLYPGIGQVTLGNSEAFAFSRGVASAGAPEMLYGELRSYLTASLNQQLDSNSLFGYAEEPVGSIVALDANQDFTATGPKSWDNIERAAREANIDYLLVMNQMRFDNTSSPTGGKGDERVKVRYLLLDAQRKNVMTGGEVEFTVEEPRTTAMTYERLAKEVARKLPFWVREEK